MEPNCLNELREQRRRVRALLSKSKRDLQFYRCDPAPGDPWAPAFSRLARKNKLSPTSSATCLMALAESASLGSFFGEWPGAPKFPASEREKKAASLGAQYLMNIEDWEAAGLSDDHPFTVGLMFRAIATLARCAALEASEVDGWEHKKKTLSALGSSALATHKWTLDSGAEGTHPALVYWFMTGIEELRQRSAGLSGLGPQRRKILSVAAEELRRQVALTRANDDLRMDPVAMGMAACVVQLLQQSVAQDAAAAGDSRQGMLVEESELRAALALLFSRQAPSGIWPKYFPLFTYGPSGANYCFSFELLEALLREFEAPILLGDGVIRAGLERALDWCETYRLQATVVDRPSGWNSGGERSELEVPESWATATVHMFLTAYERRLSEHIHRLVLELYARPSTNESKLSDLIDADVAILGRPPSLQGLLMQELVEPAKGAPKHGPLKIRRLSAILFGPPGTSKTTLVHAIANELTDVAPLRKWPVLALDPSVFLSSGLDQIHHRVKEVFDDLLDLQCGVVLLDEMDALVAKRDAKEGERLDVHRELLTTGMLPRLAELRDHAHVFFFLATNNFSQLDDAIKRPGRFDLLVQVGVPSWSNKKGKFERLMKGGSWPSTLVEQCRDAIESALDEKLRAQLDSLSIAEARVMVDSVLERGGVDPRLPESAGQWKAPEPAVVRKCVEDHVKLAYLLQASEPKRATQYESERSMSRLQ